jgi:hypothetical protein
MIVSPGIMTAAKARGDKSLAQSAAPGEPITQVDAVVGFLAGAPSPAAQPGARRLLHAMAARGRHISEDDPTSHVTSDISGAHYRLRLAARNCISTLPSSFTAEPSAHRDMNHGFHAERSIHFLVGILA